VIVRRISRIPRRPRDRWTLPQAPRQAVIAVPLVLVNALAAVGQVLWAQEHLTGNLPVLVALWLPYLFAGAVESIALFLAYEAHSARLAGGSSGYLALAAYGWAGVAGWLNWSHWNAVSTTTAVVYAAMSALSPWLWSIRSRSIHRAQLRAGGLIEDRAVKFGRARWLLYPGRTFRVFRAAVWAAEVDPLTAIGAYDAPRVKQPKPAKKSSEVPASGKNVTARAPLAAVTEAGSGTSPAPDPAVSSDPFFDGWAVERAPIGSAMTPAGRDGATSELDSVPVGKPAGSTPARSDRPANGADPIGSGGTKPTRSEPRSTRSDRRQATRSDVRVEGSDDDLLSALRSAIKVGRIKRPLTRAAVLEVVKAGGPRADVLRDQINDEDRVEIAGDGGQETDGVGAHG
jgi:uncharacterized protein DUF2637